MVYPRTFGGYLAIFWRETRAKSTCMDVFVVSKDLLVQLATFQIA